MLDRDLHTIRDLIYYQYSKLFCKSLLHTPNDLDSSLAHSQCVKKIFIELKSGVKNLPELICQDLPFDENRKVCIFCGNAFDVSPDHIVPKSLKISVRCSSCDIIHAVHNLIWVCKICNSSKGAFGLYEFYKHKYPDYKNYFDLIPPLAEMRYLRTMYHCHECAGSLDSSDPNHDGKVDVLDIDFILHLTNTN